MGKVSLFLVLAASIGSATVLYTAKQADVRASETQGQYQADVIAREIARSAFNTASADIHRFGIDVDAALRNFGTYIVSDNVAEALKCANGKPMCYRRTGGMLDGTYIVEASHDGGNGVDVYAHGEFSFDQDGKSVTADHSINESQSVGVLRVSEGGYLRIQFIDSMAGYCSAIFLERTLPGVAEEDQPLPEMVYAPGNGRNGERNVGQEIYLAPGTQMNFAIGVSTNCRAPSRFPNLTRNGSRNLVRTNDPTGADPLYGRRLLADAMEGYDFRESDWNHVHWALDGSTVTFDDPREGPWAMVETSPDNNQSWRIAFEDINRWNLAPDHPQYHNPNASLWATKQYGYDWNGSFDRRGNDGEGDGWTDNVRVEIREDDPGNPLSSYTVVYINGESDGFHDLRNTGSPADFSDQVIMVEIVPASEVASLPGGSGATGGGSSGVVLGEESGASGASSGDSGSSD